MTPIQLTPQLQEALETSHGFVFGSSYVLMSTEVYRELMGVGSEEEMAASLAAIKEGIADVRAGRAVPMEQVFRALDEQYGVQG